MVEADGVVCGDGKGMEFSVEGLRDEGEIVFVADDFGDFEEGFFEFLR